MIELTLANIKMVSAKVKISLEKIELTLANIKRVSANIEIVWTKVEISSEKIVLA